MIWPMGFVGSFFSRVLKGFHILGLFLWVLYLRVMRGFYLGFSRVCIS